MLPFMGGHNIFQYDITTALNVRLGDKLADGDGYFATNEKEFFIDFQAVGPERPT